MLEKRLAAILGPKGWVPAADSAPWARDWLDRYGVPPLGVARPASTAEVAALMAATHAAGVSVVPQGGNTGLCGAAVAGAAGGVILNLGRMAAMEPPDLAGGRIAVEAALHLGHLIATRQPHQGAEHGHHQNNQRRPQDTAACARCHAEQHQSTLVTRGWVHVPSTKNSLVPARTKGLLNTICAK